MKKKKIIISIIACIIALIALIPVRLECDDGGSVTYKAILYEINHCHEMKTYDGVSGYDIGTEVRILFFEVYNDVVFVPNE